MTGFLGAPRRRPVAVLVTHVPLLFFWLIVTGRDLADGRLTIRGSGDIDAADDPLLFYGYAVVIGAVAILIAVRIVQAARALPIARRD